MVVGFLIVLALVESFMAWATYRKDGTESAWWAANVALSLILAAKEGGWF